MKKKILILILAITSIFCFAFAGCQREDKTWVNTNYFNVNDNVLSCEVAYGAENFNTQSKFSIHEEATYLISSDELGENVITDDFLPLSQGTNLYYLTVSYKSKSTTYTLSIYKRHLYTVSFNVQGYTINDQKIEEGKLATEPVCQDWGKKFVWQFNFNAPITQNITINGSIDSLPVETINLEYYSVYLKIQNSIIKNPFDLDVDDQVIRVAVYNNDIADNYFTYYEDAGFVSIQADVFTSYGPNKSIKIMTKQTIYDINVLIASFAIREASDIDVDSSEELSPMQILGGAEKTTSVYNGNSAAYEKGNRWGGYVILGNDIDFKGQNIEFSSWAYNRYGLPKGKSQQYGFNGTFDGLGHAMINACIDSTSYHGWCSFFGNMESTGTFKNVRFINLEFKGSLAEGLFSYFIYGNIDNVYIESTLNNSGTGILGHDASNIGRLSNCVFILRTGTRPTTNSGLFGAMTKWSNFTNTYMVSDYAIPENYFISGGRNFSTSSSLIKKTLSFGEAYVLNSSTAPKKVLKDGADITSKVKYENNKITIPFGVWDVTSTFAIVWENSLNVINFDLE